MKDIEQVMKLVKSEPKKMIIYIAPQWKNVLYKLAKDSFAEEAFNIGKIMSLVKNHETLNKYMKNIADEAKLMMKDPTIFRISMLTPDEQLNAIQGYIKIINKKYPEITVETYISDTKDVFDPQNKARKARPMKPAILLL